jgi:hypothetical protein
MMRMVLVLLLLYKQTCLRGIFKDGHARTCILFKGGCIVPLPLTLMITTTRRKTITTSTTTVITIIHARAWQTVVVLGNPLENAILLELALNVLGTLAIELHLRLQFLTLGLPIFDRARIIHIHLNIGITLLLVLAKHRHLLNTRFVGIPQLAKVQPQLHQLRPKQVGLLCRLMHMLVFCYGCVVVVCVALFLPSSIRRVFVLLVR